MRLQDWATPRWVGAAWLLFIVFSLTWFQVGPYGAMDEAGGIPDEAFDKTPASVQAQVAGWNATTQETYRAFLVGDLLYPLVFIPMASLTILWVAKRFAWLRHAAWMPVAGGVLDWVENGLMFAVLGGADATAYVAASLAKLVLVSASFLVILGCLGYKLGASIMNPMGR